MTENPQGGVIINDIEGRRPAGFIPLSLVMEVQQITALLLMAPIRTASKYILLTPLLCLTNMRKPQ